MSKSKTKWYVNINKHTIASNKKKKENAPPIRVSRGKNGKGEYYHGVSLPAGSVVLYDARKPILKCGAHVVIECPEEPRGTIIEGFERMADAPKRSKETVQTG